MTKATAISAASVPPRSARPTIDLLPTIAALTKTPLPADLKIDGLDISPILTGDAESPREEFIYYNRNHPAGIRQGDWKYLTGEKNNAMLFNLAEDLGEKNNLAAQNPELVERLRQRMAELNATIIAEARPVWKMK